MKSAKGPANTPSSPLMASAERWRAPAAWRGHANEIVTSGGAGLGSNVGCRLPSPPSHLTQPRMAGGRAASTPHSYSSLEAGGRAAPAAVVCATVNESELGRPTSASMLGGARAGVSGSSPMRPHVSGGGVQDGRNRLLERLDSRYAAAMTAIRMYDIAMLQVIFSVCCTRGSGGAEHCNELKFDLTCGWAMCSTSGARR